MLLWEDDEIVGVKHKTQYIWRSVSTNGLLSSFLLLILLHLPFLLLLLPPITVVVAIVAN